jgi:hypothetical protein
VHILGSNRGRGLPALLALVLLAGCMSKETREASAYWRDLRRESVETSRRFLAAAARGDSSAVAEVATDSVAREVMLYHRNGAARPLQAASAGFREKSVRLYGFGADVVFTYRDGNADTQGEVTLLFDKRKLKVTSFGTFAKVD